MTGCEDESCAMWEGQHHTTGCSVADPVKISVTERDLTPAEIRFHLKTLDGCTTLLPRIDARIIRQLIAYIDRHSTKIAELAGENFKLSAEVGELMENVCDACDPDNYGWIFNAVEGRAACGCIVESEAFQIIYQALQLIAQTSTGTTNTLAAAALHSVRPLDNPLT